MELTILMPCLNEAETLAACIRKAKQFLMSEKISGEILIADNGSEDGSKNIAVTEGARIVQVSQRGYGAALIQGIQAAQGKYIIMGDADDSYDFANLMPFLQCLRAGHELVMGNRFRGGIEQGAMPFLNKYLGNPILSLLGRLFFKTSLGDFHCGLRGFNTQSIQKLNLRAPGMEFASEMIAKSILQKLKITEVPTTLSIDGRSRKPHLRPWRDGWRHLRLLLLLSPKWLFYYPGLFLLLFGTCLMMVLVPGPLPVNHSFLDIHTMLFSSIFIVVGLQAILFFVFARVLLFGLDEKILKFFSLEKGLVLGGFLTGLGVTIAIYSFTVWMHRGFGNLVPTEMMRMLIPAFTFLLSGMQIVFASFFISCQHLTLSSAIFSAESTRSL